MVASVRPVPPHPDSALDLIGATGLTSAQRAQAVSLAGLIVGPAARDVQCSSGHLVAALDAHRRDARDTTCADLLAELEAKDERTAAAAVRRAVAALPGGA